MMNSNCFPRDVLARFAIHASLHPDAPAIAWKDKVVTYGELMARCQGLSARLRQLGVGPETVVGIRMERSDELVTAMMAVLHAGASYLPLDLSIPRERATYMLEASGANVLLIDAESDIDVNAGGMTALPVATRTASHSTPATMHVTAHPEQLAYVLYTSGSTGKPKGVQISRGALDNAIASFERVLDAKAHDVFLSVTGISFDIFELELMLPLTTGGLLVLAERARLFESGYLADLATRHGATLFQTTPTLARNLLDSGWQPAPALRILIGGEVLVPELVERFAQAQAVFNVYGPTEATIWVSADRVVCDGTPPAIGTALKDTRLHVLGPDLAPLPVGESGELFIGGVQLARGYAGRPDLTADRFIPSPFGAGDRLYRTGDLVRRTEGGTLEYLGRADQQVKLRGHRIELGEIEAVLGMHPGVASAITVVREDTPSNPLLVAYYTAAWNWLDQQSGGDLARAQSAAWEDIYDERYAEEGDAAGNGDHSVWIDSRTGEPYAASQMEEWIETTVTRIAAFGARRILEIGCGSGQLLLRLADTTERYVGTDVSTEALRVLRRKTDRLSQVELLRMPADRTRELAPERFELVVINSVAQYFPSSAYLVDVLEQARRLLAPGGTIFVGDVRSRDLLSAFYAAVETGGARKPLPAAELAQRVAQRAKLENELCVDPSFFVGLKDSLDLRAIQLLSRRGYADTEMNAFRFDVVLHAQAIERTAVAAPRTIGWRADSWNAVHFEKLLETVDDRPLRIDGLPDARSRAVLGALHGDPGRTAVGGFHPEDLITVAQRFGLTALAGAPGSRGTFDLLVTSSKLRPVDFELIPHGSVATAPGDLTTRPLQAESLRRLEEELRSVAARHLPEYMVPSLFVHVDRFPLNTSGKLDRYALPRPVTGAMKDDAHLHDEAQAAVADAIAEVLALPQRPGPQADFFRLGGHSLGAVRLATRLRERFGSAFDLHAVFELRTVEALASRLREAGARCEAAHVIALGDYAAGTRVQLSHAQRALWFLDRLDGASAIYNMPFAVRIEGELDVLTLERAIAKVLDRHQSLRTTYVESQGAPEGVVNDAGELRLAVEECAAEGLEVRLVEIARMPFNLGAGTMLRARLLRVDDRTHVLLVIAHHIAADGLSMAVLAREIAALYAGESLPPPAAQYADFARWQGESISESELESQLAWWRWHLQDAPDTLELPTERSRPPVAAHRGSCVHIAIDAALRLAVEDFARSHEASAYAVLLSAFGILLGRLSNRREVIVGVPAAGRKLRQFERAVGMFVNVLPIRIDAPRQASVADFVHATSAVLRRALACQDVSFDQIVDHLGVARSLDRMPLVQAAFTYLDELEELPLAGLRTETIPLHLGTSRFDLALQLAASSDGGWRGIVEFDSDLFNAASVTRWAGHFEGLLRAMCHDVAAHIADLPLAGPREFARPLAENEVEDFVLAFERRCEEIPEALALVCGEERLTFVQLAARADRVATALHSAGVGFGDVVGLHLDRNVHLLAAIWGVLKAGAAFLPLDISIPTERVHYMLSQAGARWVISESMGPASNGDRVVMTPVDLLAGHDAAAFRAVRVPPQSLAYVIFTSGSTGLPKGVECTREGWSFFARDFMANLRLDRGDMCWSGTSIGFDIFLCELLGAHSAGAGVVIADRRHILDADYVSKLMERERVTIVVTTPSMVAAWCAGGWVPRPGLRLVTGGEAISPELAERLSVQCELWNAYGPTEVTCAQTMGRLRAPIGVRASMGVAFGRNEAFVLDRRLNPVPIGVVGELYIAGDQLARGYAGRPDLTADRFIPSPFHHGERLYRTGDLVRWRVGGELEHCGRDDDQVKVRGYRIELGEIEGSLLACEGVASAAVIASENTAGDKRLVAYVVPDAGMQVDVRSLETQLNARLPAYMIPAHFVPLSYLPITRNGKLDKKALPAPDRPATTVGQEVATRVSLLEGQIAALMARVLGIERPIPTDTHFFTSGGHSLAAVRLLADVRRELGAEVSLRCFFEDPTPAGLARVVRGTGAHLRARSPFVCFSKEARGPAVFLVHGADGHAINFRHLGEELAPHVRLYGIDCAQAWLPDVKAAGLGVRELAELYVDHLIRDFPQLDGFHVGGWSFGGLVALEMARELRSRGLRVTSAFAIDSAIHGAAEDVRGALSAKVAIQDFARRNLLEVGYAQGDLERLFDPRSLPGALDELYAGFGSNIAAAAGYRPAAYDGDFTLIIASEGVADDAASQERWRAVVQGKLAMPEIQGGHLSILRAPAVAALAREIVNCVLASNLVEQ